MRTREDIVSAVHDGGIIAIVRLISPGPFVEIAEALVRGGVRVIEFTLNTPGALGGIRDCVDRLGDEAVIGAGTVIAKDDAQRAMDAGAEILVSPGLDESVVETAHAAGRVAIPGAYTPTEIMRARATGADFVKLFPAKGLGPQYLREIRAPLGDLPLVPTGGVTLDNVAEYVEAGAAALAIGTGLVNDALIEARNFNAITDRARAFREAMDAARNKQ